MSKLLDQAFAAARRLSTEEQEALGAIILDEIADEARWAKSFARSQERLAELADEALRELKNGRATPLELPPNK